ncbi:MAG: ATP synthase F1 subunit delta [Bacillota bacterium]|nr:ATP synthase F1 subunit delta [Bacillota bacterium]
MTAGRVLARRYARALFLAARAAGKVEKAEADLAQVRQALDQVPQLRQILGGVAVPRARQRELLQGIFAGRVDGLVMNLLLLLLDERRLRLLDQIEREFRIMADEARGITLVEVISARALSGPAEEALRQGLERKLGRRVRMECTVDAALVGGVQVKIGDTLYDGSVRGQLERLKERMVARA